MTKLVDKALGAFRLFHDALLIVLANGATELVVVHGRPVLTLPPKTCYSHRVFDFEHPSGSVEPTNAAAIQLGLAEQFLQELPQVDVRAGAGARTSCSASGLRRTASGAGHTAGTGA